MAIPLPVLLGGLMTAGSLYDPISDVGQALGISVLGGNRRARKMLEMEAGFNRANALDELAGGYETTDLNALLRSTVGQKQPSGYGQAAQDFLEESRLLDLMARKKEELSSQALKDDGLPSFRELVARMGYTGAT